MTPVDLAHGTSRTRSTAAWKGVSPFSSLRARLSFVILLALIPVVLFLLLDILTIRRQVETAAQAELLSQAQFVADAYGQELDEMQRVLGAIALYPEVQHGDAAACSARLAQVAELYKPEFRGFGVSNLDGVMFCTSAPVSGTIQIADRRWFREAISTGKFAIGDYSMGRPSGLPLLGIGYPVVDGQGKVVSVVSHSLLLSRLDAQAQALPLAPDATITITDRRGTILLRTPGGEEWVGRTQPDPALQHLEEGGPRLMEAQGIDGVHRLYAVAPIRGPSGDQVWLSIGRTPEVLYAAVTAVILRDLVAIGATLLAALAAIWIGSNRLVLRRVDQLVDASTRLARGDCQVSAPVGTSADELDRLALTFNAMAGMLRQRQAELQLLNDSLEQRVAQRTAELERSNRELDRFAYVASHDLKSPLRAIDNLAAWIAEDATGVLAPQSQAHLSKLRGRVQRLESLLNDLLLYSRAGRRRYAVEWVDVAALVRTLVDRIELPPGMRVTIQGELPPIRGERVPLDVVMRNLIENAIKHHHRPQEGVIVISAAVEPSEQADGWVEFCVRDNGPGIDPEYHNRIFEVFQTLRPRDEVEGSGMGLAIVQKTIEAVGGRVWVVSARGEGAAFYFTYPRSASADDGAP